MCCSSFVNETVSVFGAAPLINTSKLIGLEVIIFFVAGIGLKNVKSLKRGEFIAAALIPMFFLVISGIDANGTSFASTIIISTFTGIILEASLIYAVANEKLTKAAKYTALFAVYILVGINCAVIMFNNSISSAATVEYFMGNNKSAETEELIFDSDFDLPAISSGDQYLVIPVDLNDFEVSDSVIDNINYISSRSTGEWMFNEVFFGIENNNGFTNVDKNEYKLDSGVNDITVRPYIYEPGDRLFIYCSAENGATVKVRSDIGESEVIFTGPFITEVGNGAIDFSVDLSVRSNGDETCRMSLYQLNEDVLTGMQRYSGNSGTTSIKVDTRSLSGSCTLILPIAYDDDTKIRVDGITCDTFDFCGNTALSFDADNSESIFVTVEQQDPGILTGILISAFAIMCLVAIPLVQRYNDKKKEVTGEGNDQDA